jgi:hypothetical protein
MVCFQTKNPNLSKFWWVLLLIILVYFMTIWSILRPLEICYGHLVYFVVIWYIFPHFGILYQEKSGNPDRQVNVADGAEDRAGESAPRALQRVGQGIDFIKPILAENLVD